MNQIQSTLYLLITPSKLISYLEQMQEENQNELLGVSSNEESMNPQAAIKALSLIFADTEEEGHEHKSSFSPQARIILLTIVLCATVLAMYTIFESFIDTIILAVLSGIAYVRLREQFVLFLKKSTYQSSKKSSFTVLLESVGYFLLIVLIPWIRHIFSQDFSSSQWREVLYSEVSTHVIDSILEVFLKTNNIIKMTQIYLFIKIIVNLFGKPLTKVYFMLKNLVTSIIMKGDNSKNKIEKVLHILFFIVFVLSILILIVVFAGLFFEFSSMVSTAGKSIQKYHNCTFYSLDNDTDALSQCSETITGSLKSYLPSIQRKHQVSECINRITAEQQKYLNFTFFQHKKEICLVYQIVKEQSPQVIDQLFDIQVTKQYLLTFLKNVLKLLSMTSDTIFSLTTYISIFIMTVKSYTHAKHQFSLFGDHQNQLLSNITNLIYDYIMVTFKHLVFSMVLFQIFRFSQFNIILSLIIAGITLFPLISVSMIMLIFSVVKYFWTVGDNYLGVASAAICLVVFYFGSANIFKNHFNKMDFNNTLVSLSAVFGLYRFGVAGIFYGPLVILLFICAYDALGKSKT